MYVLSPSSFLSVNFICLQLSFALSASDLAGSRRTEEDVHFFIFRPFNVLISYLPQLAFALSSSDLAGSRHADEDVCFFPVILSQC
jgi:hypothetical protein